MHLARHRFASLSSTKCEPHQISGHGFHGCNVLPSAHFATEVGNHSQREVEHVTTILFGSFLGCWSIGLSSLSDQARARYGFLDRLLENGWLGGVVPLAALMSPVAMGVFRSNSWVPVSWSTSCEAGRRVPVRGEGRRQEPRGPGGMTKAPGLTLRGSRGILQAEGPPCGRAFYRQPGG